MKRRREKENEKRKCVRWVDSPKKPSVSDPYADGLRCIWLSHRILNDACLNFRQVVSLFRPAKTHLPNLHHTHPHKWMLKWKNKIIREKNLEQ